MKDSELLFQRGRVLVLFGLSSGDSGSTLSSHFAGCRDTAFRDMRNGDVPSFTVSL